MIKIIIQKVDQNWARVRFLCFDSEVEDGPYLLGTIAPHIEDLSELEEAFVSIGWEIEYEEDIGN